MFAFRQVTVAAVLALTGAGFAFAQATPAKPAAPAKAAAAPAAGKGETIRIAFMDPLSGPFANVGQNQLKSWQFAA